MERNNRKDALIMPKQMRNGKDECNGITGTAMTKDCVSWEPNNAGVQNQVKKEQGLYEMNKVYGVFLNARP